MFTKTKILALLLLFTYKVNAQVRLPDSVKTVKQKALFYAKIANSNIKQDSAIFYSDKAIKYAYQCNDCTDILYKSIFNKIVFLYNMGKSKVALSQLKALDSLLKIKNDDYYRFKSAFQHSLIYTYSIDKPEEALNYGKKALVITSKMKDSTLIAESYYLLSNIYTNFKKDSIAREYLKKAYKICDNLNENNNLFLRVYFSLINLSKTEKEYETYTKECLELINNNKTTANTYKAYFYVLKGTTLRENFKKYKKAKENLLIGLQKCKETNYKVMYDFALLELGQVENKLKNYQKAIEYFKGYLNVKDFSLENQLIANEGLAFAYANLNQFKKSIFYKDELLRIKDSLQKNNATKDFAKFNVKLATAQKDKEIAQQKLQLAQEKSKRNKLLFGSVFALFLGFIGFQWNNNRQKRKKLLAESELEKEHGINQLRTKFLGNIAHEIRTPLTLISGNLELAKENIHKKEKALQNIDVALINSKKVVEDANEILELLKFEKNKVTVKQNVVDLETTLKRIFFSFKSLAQLKQIELIYKSIIPENYYTKIDVEKVEKILNNLISNAIKYSPSNRKVVFETFIENKQLQVNVIDYGQGIHFNETEKIFQRFYQASNSQSVGGIGIGLSLAKEFAELLNGTLTVKSELKKGSIFTVKLPIEQVDSLTDDVATDRDLELINREDQTLQTKQNQQQKPIFSKEKRTVLIVEDNPEMSNYLVEILHDYYNCITAFDGLEALEKLKTQQVDLITSDIMMPNLDGFQFRERLIQNEKLKNIPFILISAKNLAEDKIKGFQLGIDDYIIKPFNKSELLARINNLLQNKLDREKWLKENPEKVEKIATSQQKLLEKIKAVVVKNINDENFKIAQLATEIGYSQRQLTRILKQYTGMSPVKFILEIRLQKAYSLLQGKAHFNLSELRYDIGITSSSYFNKKFKERFGVNPNELIR